MGPPHTYRGEIPLRTQDESVRPLLKRPLPLAQRVIEEFVCAPGIHCRALEREDASWLLLRVCRERNFRPFLGWWYFPMVGFLCAMLELFVGSLLLAAS
jgi:hypothetical protein